MKVFHFAQLLQKEIEEFFTYLYVFGILVTLDK